MRQIVILQVEKNVRAVMNTKDHTSTLVADVRFRRISATVLASSSANMAVANARLCRPLGKGGERRLVWLPYALIGRLISLSLFFFKVHDSSRKAKEALAQGQRRNIQPDAAEMIRVRFSACLPQGQAPKD